MGISYSNISYKDLLGESYNGKGRYDIGYVKEGKGHCFYENNDEYLGYFYKDLRHGYGKMIFSNGDLYEGQWKCNLMNGNGK